MKKRSARARSQVAKTKKEKKEETKKKLKAMQRRTPRYLVSALLGPSAVLSEVSSSGHPALGSRKGLVKCHRHHGDRFLAKPTPEIARETCDPASLLSASPRMGAGGMDWMDSKTGWENITVSASSTVRKCWAFTSVTATVMAAVKG